MRPLFFRTFFLGIITCLLPVSVDAASLYIDPPTAELNRGDTVEMSVRLDVDEAVNECVNAIDAVISYTSNVVPVDISLGDSIFSMWVEEPKINEAEQTISFAGGMPNGYCGRIAGDPRLTNSLVTLIFRSPGFIIGGGNLGDEAKLEFTEFTTAYLNDGLGTQVAPRTFGATLSLDNELGSSIDNPWKEAVELDVVPPEDFSIFLDRNDRAFSGDYFISFSTTDKQTGIDQYQVIEEPLSDFGSFDWGRADAPWVTVRSPHVLEDQTLNSTIRVKAIDKAGNEYIATLIPDESLRTAPEVQTASYALYGVIILIILGCLGVIVTFFIERRRRRRKNVSEEFETELEEEITEEQEV